VILQIALGSAAGGVARYLLTLFIQGRVGVTYPWGTLAVNVTGSFAIGLLLPVLWSAPAISPETRAFLTTGFCGGYTTFSTFSWEAVRLIEGGHVRAAALYVGASVVLALTATLAGIAAGRWALGSRVGT
jgi:fluoride exporter